jgi:hypothetical protein
MNKKQNPVAGCTAGGAEDCLAQEQVNSRPAQPKSKQFYWLHVRADGGEERHQVEPTHVPTLTVEVIEDRGSAVLERAWTRRMPISIDGNLWIKVASSGLGWAFEKEDTDSASWVRVRTVLS